MKELIDARTLEAIRHYGDEATLEFYRRLKERRLSSTRCRACREVAFPPRSFCPSCHAQEVEWVDLPHEGVLYAFTTQERAVRFGAPEVIGLVDLPGVGRILSLIEGRYPELAIGQRLLLDFVEVSPELVLHRFKPA